MSRLPLCVKVRGNQDGRLLLRSFMSRDRICGANDEVTRSTTTSRPEAASSSGLRQHHLSTDLILPVHLGLRPQQQERHVLAYVLAEHHGSKSWTRIVFVFCIYLALFQTPSTLPFRAKLPVKVLADVLARGYCRFMDSLTVSRLATRDIARATLSAIYLICPFRHMLTRRREQILSQQRTYAYRVSPFPSRNPMFARMIAHA